MTNRDAFNSFLARCAEFAEKQARVREARERERARREGKKYIPSSDNDDDETAIKAFDKHKDYYKYVWVWECVGVGVYFCRWCPSPVNAYRSCTGEMN